MGDAESIWNLERDSHFVPALAECGTCHIDSRLFLIIAASPQRTVILVVYEQMLL